ncbi:serine hydrolase domain-containing protein [Pseudochryseolinea flava]|uniref:Serine hydrolase n=1 Tax=Pseudochryseolinea flava TaxID=2059302 RepID=A0A364XW35_9BACT|nr:serine hydrolase [Pseudochryseolinea flava]RAV98567.1 serine hydrolase [Pseudochryseolinea flava]
MKKLFRFLTVLIIIIILAAVVYVGIYFPPVMTGMAAKTMCSCLFVAERSEQSIRDKELQVFPGLSSMDMLIEDASVSASFLGTTRKAIYRKGLGCILLSERTEEEVRSQQPVLSTAPNVNRDSVAWPLGDDLTAQGAITGVQYDSIKNAVDKAFFDKDPENPIFTHAVVVVYDGKIIAEKYADGFDKQSRMMGWSMTKSITNALIGILVKEGKLTVEAGAPVPEWEDDIRKNITLNNLLQATTGLAWDESYFNPSADFHTMFIHRDDKAAYAASMKQKVDPGTFFQYSSGSTNILSRIIRQTVGDDQYYKFPYEKLFFKVGMSRAIMEPDASGTFVASSYSYASARDWARFGLLYLNDGVVQGERILPEGWVKYSTTPSAVAPRGEYGAQVWLNHGAPNDPENRLYPTLPQDTFLFDGFEHNFVVVVPSKKLVVVRLGVTHNKNFDLEALVRGIIAGIQ